MQKKLKKGDVIYSHCYGGVDSRLIIDKTTKTQAITLGGSRFRIEYNENSGMIKVVGEQGYGTTQYYIETPDLKAKFIRRKMESAIKNINLKDLSNEKLEKIYTILKSE